MLKISDWLWRKTVRELEAMEHIEIHLLVEIGQLLEGHMADFTALQAAVDNLGTDSTADHDQILAAFEDLGAEITDLKTQIEALTAGQVSQETIDALTATVTAADAAFDATAATVAPVVVAPPV
jgi:TRAP-type uncharacterized transport system substrate-binding protein